MSLNFCQESGLKIACFRITQYGSFVKLYFMQIPSKPGYIFAALPSFIVRFKMSIGYRSNLEFYSLNSGVAMAHLRLLIPSA
jgi:hypothetical protein